jgi:hypothetical protein
LAGKDGSMNIIEFPQNVIQGLARKFADTYSNYLESPWEFWTFSFLTCLGNLVAPHVTLRSSLSVQPRLYTVLLGESADDRKSECIKQTKAIFSEAFLQKFHPCETVGSGEALIQQLKKFPNTLLIYDELQAFFEKARIPRSILFECANTLFEENRIQSHTKDRQIEVDSGHLSILGASTIDTFMNMWNLKVSEMGFLNRLWLVQARAEKRFPIPKPIPEEKKTFLKDELIRLFNDISSKGVSVFKLTSEARTVFDDWYENSKNSLFSKRLDAYGHRLMVLFCVNEGKSTVNSDIAERVVKLLSWQKKMRRKFDPIDAVGILAKLEASIRRAIAQGAINERDLKRAVHYNRYPIHLYERAKKDLLRTREMVFNPEIKKYVKGNF